MEYNIDIFHIVGFLLLIFAIYYFRCQCCEQCKKGREHSSGHGRGCGCCPRCRGPGCGCCPRCLK